MACVWVAGKTVRSPCYHVPYLSALEMSVVNKHLSPKSKSKSKSKHSTLKAKHKSKYSNSKSKSKSKY